METLLGRDGRNETESTHTMWAPADLKPSEIDLSVSLRIARSQKLELHKSFSWSTNHDRTFY